MPSPKTQPARGMRDFLPADVRKREYVISVIKEVYERYGFEPLETPALENIDTLMGKYGEEGNQLIFKILKRGEHEKTGEADLALRYDLTVPLARVVAQYQNELPKFFKRYQIQPVWRADRPARGRFREFYQCDVDVLGSRSMVVEAELIAAASDALVALGFNDFTIRLNHRQVLIGLADSSGIRRDHIEPALTTIDKLDKIGIEGVERELSERIGPLSTGRLLGFFRELKSLDHAADLAPEEITEKENALNAAILGRLVEFVGNNEGAASGVAELQTVLRLSESTGAARRIQLDPSLARGLSYYTGAIMEISVEGIGSLGGGGRYDNLVGMFLGKDVPACGFSLGLERIIVVMDERKMFPPQLISSPADVMVNALGEDCAREALGLAADLRQQGLKVFVYPEPNDKFQKQLSFANKKDIPICCVIGENESQRGVVLVKQMWGGGEEFVSGQVVVDVVKDLLLNAIRTRELDEEMRQKLAESGKELLQKYKDRF